MIKSVTFVLSGALLQMLYCIHGGWDASLAAIFGLALFFVGLSKLKAGLDKKGQEAVNLLMVAGIISLVGFVFDLITPLHRLACVAFIISYLVEMIGFIKLKTSDRIGETGENGVNVLLIAMILVITKSTFGMIPYEASNVASIFSIVAMVLVFFGWIQIQQGLMETSIHTRS